jgi:2-keto-4-pentenoate hydratase/2-oxohepta-3-ene-1,7-dioic acid hydratase in catechol pathway
MKSRWEVELVAVIGRGGREISESYGWDHVRG